MELQLVPFCRHLTGVLNCHSTVHTIRYTDHDVAKPDVMLQTWHTTTNPAQQSDLDVLKVELVFVGICGIFEPDK